MVSLVNRWTNSTTQSTSLTSTAHLPPTTLTKDFSSNMPPNEYSSVVLLASLVVFGLPALIISVICLLRLRIHLLEKKERKTGFQRRIVEVSSLMTSLPVSQENTVDIIDSEKPMLSLEDQQPIVHFTKSTEQNGVHAEELMVDS